MGYLSFIQRVEEFFEHRELQVLWREDREILFSTTTYRRGYFFFYFSFRSVCTGDRENGLSGQRGRMFNAGPKFFCSLEGVVRRGGVPRVPPLHREGVAALATGVGPPEARGRP